MTKKENLWFFKTRVRGNGYVSSYGAYESFGMTIEEANKNLKDKLHKAMKPKYIFSGYNPH